MDILCNLKIEVHLIILIYISVCTLIVKTVEAEFFLFVADIKITVLDFTVFLLSQFYFKRRFTVSLAYIV